MAKAKGRPKGDKPRMVAVKMEESIVVQAKMIALARKVSLAEYLSDLNRQLVQREFDREMQRLTKKEPKP